MGLFEVGQRVRFTKSVDSFYKVYEGKLCTVTKYTPETGKYRVEFDDKVEVGSVKQTELEPVVELKKEPVELSKEYTSEKETVNHPSHYNKGKFETIELIEAITEEYTDNPYVGFCIGNVVKYVHRAPYKHEEMTEDLRKAERYIQFALEHLEQTEEGEE